MDSCCSSMFRGSTIVLKHSNKNMIYKKNFKLIGKASSGGGGVSPLGPDYKQIRITLTVTSTKIIQSSHQLAPKFGSCVFSEHPSVFTPYPRIL